MMPLATDNIERNRKWERVALADVLVRLLRMAASIHVLTGYKSHFNTHFDELRRPYIKENPLPQTLSLFRTIHVNHSTST